MDVLSAGLVGVTLQLVVSLLVWWLRLRWQVATERQRGQLAVDLAVQLRRTGGRLHEQRTDGSVIDLTVTGPNDGQ
jgi:hypothetical protein